MPPTRAVSGFVLAGGQSRRMGRDKALLSFGGETLVEHVASVVAEATGSATTLLGDPQKYGALGFGVLADRIPGQGPMSGLHAALHASETPWILLVACDLPAVDAALLRSLMSNAVERNAVCVAAESPRGLEPLCAVYHRSTLPAVERALAEGHLRMRDLVSELGAAGVAAGDRLTRNVNTEDDWRLHLAEIKQVDRDF